MSIPINGIYGYPEALYSGLYRSDDFVCSLKAQQNGATWIATAIQILSLPANPGQSEVSNVYRNDNGQLRKINARSMVSVGSH
ncbi:MAG: hypothetical protein R2867_13300 [Caldilineaceae bacterium]